MAPAGSTAFTRMLNGTPSTAPLLGQAQQPVLRGGVRGRSCRATHGVRRSADLVRDPRARRLTHVGHDPEAAPVTIATRPVDLPGIVIPLGDGKFLIVR